MPYSMDTSAFLDAWIRHYPADIFHTAWVQLDRAARNGTLIACDEVLRELSQKDDGAHEWMKARPKMVLSLDGEIEAHVRYIMERYPRLVDTRRGKSGGDPFVIAVARARTLTVITGENPTGRIERPRIPDVCADLDIRCIKLLDFFREQNWTF